MRAIATLDNEALAKAEALIGPKVAAVSLGALKESAKTLDLIENLPRAALAFETEVRAMIAARSLFKRGIGYTDAHLLAVTLLEPGLRLRTLDARLARTDDRLGVLYA